MKRPGPPRPSDALFAARRTLSEAQREYEVTVAAEVGIEGRAAVLGRIVAAARAVERAERLEVLA